MPAGETRVVVIDFVPASAGAKIATLILNSNDPDTSSLNVVLVGTGVTSDDGGDDPGDGGGDDPGPGGSGDPDGDGPDNNSNIVPVLNLLL